MVTQIHSALYIVNYFLVLFLIKFYTTALNKGLAVERSLEDKFDDLHGTDI